MTRSTANAEQYDAWNGESGARWVAGADRRDAVLRPFLDLLLDAASIEPGERVLDVGCGCGATTLAAAARAAPGGGAVGFDLSGPMLEVARDRAARAGARAAFVHGDAQTDRAPGTFDVAISRFGTMFFSDPAAAFANVGAHLRDGGRLCAVTWQPLAANEWLVLPGAVLARYGTPPDAAAPGPGMFGQSDPAVLERQLTSAGFRHVTCAPRELALDFGATPADAVAYLVDSSAGRAALEAVPPDRREEALGAAREALAPHARDGSVHLGAAVWVTTAER